MKTFERFVKDRVASGKYAFTTAEALHALSITHNALKCGMYKLKKKKEVISPKRGMYVILPTEYRSMNTLPPNELIPLISRLLGVKYYVGLLSAALYHGASHQKPQVFQVISDKRLNPINLGQMRIEFIYKKSIANLPIEKKVVKTGYLEVASAELTAMDLFLYSHHSGGINHIATVLSELIESMDAQKLIALIDQSSEKSWVQRLGFVLERIDPMDTKKRDELVEAIYEKIKKNLTYHVPLLSAWPTEGASRDNRWWIIENSTVESDI